MREVMRDMRAPLRGLPLKCDRALLWTGKKYVCLYIYIYIYIIPRNVFAFRTMCFKSVRWSGAAVHSKCLFFIRYSLARGPELTAANHFLTHICWSGGLR